MKKETCDYFPPLPARWYCPHCEINLSTPCVRARDNHWDGVPEQRCPICLGALKSLGITGSIPPFWTRLPQFLAYPLKLEAMAYLLCVTLINFLPVISFDDHFDIILQGLSVTVSAGLILLYAFTCLNCSAKGNLKAPQFSVAQENHAVVKMSLIWKQLLVYAIFIVTIVFSSILGVPGVLVCTALIMFALPASTMLISITGSILAAVNPPQLWGIIKAIGGCYVIFYGLLLLMLVCQFFLQSQSVLYLPSVVVLPIIVFMQGYFSFVMFAMMGYVLYQYHEKLGLKRVNEFEADQRKAIPELSADTFMNEITILLRENLPKVAIKRLKAKIYDTGHLDYHERLNQILQAPEYTEELLQHGSGYIDAIFRSQETENKQLQRAANAYQACLRVNPDFFYPNAKIVVKLANYAQQKGRHHLTHDLLVNFQVRFPENRLIPEACFLLATTLVDHLGDDNDAKQIFLFLLTAYPEHPLISQVREYLQLLNKLEK